MYLDNQQADALSRAIRVLSGARDEYTLRMELGALLLKALRADYLASYVWDARTGAFVNGLMVNMTLENLRRYDSYFQFNDPITHEARRRRVPTRISDVLPHPLMLRTDFYNDFLRQDGLYWGVSMFAEINGETASDLRIWRGRKGENFSDHDLDVLRLIAPSFDDAVERCRSQQLLTGTSSERLERILHSLPRITPAEQRVVQRVVQGMSDKAIARSLEISPTTVRTHLDSACRKLGVRGRVQLAARLAHYALMAAPD